MYSSVNQCPIGSTVIKTKAVCIGRGKDDSTAWIRDSQPSLGVVLTCFLNHRSIIKTTPFHTPPTDRTAKTRPQKDQTTKGNVSKGSNRKRQCLQQMEPQKTRLKRIELQKTTSQKDRTAKTTPPTDRSHYSFMHLSLGIGLGITVYWLRLLLRQRPLLHARAQTIAVTYLNN
jgi:hypothetical protein